MPGGASSRAPAGGEAGSVTVGYVAVVGLSLLVVVAAANLVVHAYGRGVVRAAVDEGARAGARASAGPDDCERAARAVLADLLAGSMGREVTVACAVDGGLVVARATATFRGWLPGVPDRSFTIEGIAVAEAAP